ncbi:Wzt carbohydrate-binding domain-containing protein [Synechocystis sp. B12]|nr:Wzt carbohydrate-binding domain-containing protein [Synechocystis sp. B12]
MLSRITEPTTGRVELHGRVASLLEVGTGFHPELTGRENIYLNGAILGMTRREIKAKFDEIVDFAEVEKFLDTPVKRYSSGMYVRLAFAVAAHLEPEILVVDEVLAVGDAAFQKKCLGKMGDVAEKEGRTVLFVSHNMATIKTLCSKGIHLKEGKLSSQNDIEKVINDYSNTQQGNQVIYLANKVQETPYIKKIYISQADNTRSNIFAMDQPIIIEIETKNHRNNELVIGVVIRNSQGMLIHHSSNEFRDKNAYELTNNSLSRITKCIIPPYALSSGQYSADFVVAERNYELFEKISDALTFEVEFTGKVSEKTTANDWKGVCAPGILLWI